jgi:phosphoribosylamine---glycine ligase
LRFLVVGGGAREHAMARALAKSPDTEVVVISKSKNPGLARLAKKYLVGDETSAEFVAKVAKDQRIECAVVGPEAPLASGVTDALRKLHILVASPSKAAAEIETSKRFMRDLLTKHKIPGNCRSVAFETAHAAKESLKKDGLNVALKPIGLTGGKGVKVYGDHFTDFTGAAAYVDEVFQNHIGGNGILIEERLEGEEFTIQCFSDGRRVVPTVAIQDHKRLLPNDEGPNTGGMGSYSQADGLLPFLDKAALEDAVSIVRKIVQALAAENRSYVGPIYGQFMLTKDGPKVIEINARFGDPEAMNVLSLLETPYAEIAARMAGQGLAGIEPRFERLASVVKYVVPQGYGTKPVSGAEIKVDLKAIEKTGAELYYANVEEKTANTLICGTSRGIAVLGRGETIHTANEACEAALKHVKGDKLHVRHDIGTKELLDRRVAHMRQLRGRRT